MKTIKLNSDQSLRFAKTITSPVPEAPPRLRAEPEPEVIGLSQPMLDRLSVLRDRITYLLQNPLPMRRTTQSHGMDPSGTYDIIIWEFGIKDLSVKNSKALPLPASSSPGSLPQP